MKFNRGKCQVLPLGRKNSRDQYSLEVVQLESSFGVKDLEVQMDTKLNMNQLRRQQ